MSVAATLNLIYVMHEYYRAGHSLRQTARRFGVTHPTVRTAFRRHGLPVRSRVHGLIVRRNIRPETLQMYADYQAGMSFNEIGLKYHYSAQTVRKRFRMLSLGRVQR